jgi:hypothetical protein
MNSQTIQMQTQAVQEGKEAALVSCTVFLGLKLQKQTTLIRN